MSTITAEDMGRMVDHAQEPLTMNTYSHVIPELQRDAADRMNRLLGG